MGSVPLQILQRVHHHRAPSVPRAARLVQPPILPNSVALQRPRPHPYLTPNLVPAQPNLKPNLNFRRPNPKLHPLHNRLRDEYGVYLYLLLCVCLLFEANLEYAGEENTQYGAGGGAEGIADGEYH